MYFLTQRDDIFLPIRIKMEKFGILGRRFKDPEVAD